MFIVLLRFELFSDIHIKVLYSIYYQHRVTFIS